MWKKDSTMKRATILLVLCLVAGGCGSAVSHVEVFTTDTCATIRWDTWEYTTGLIKYGETSAMGLKHYENGRHFYELFNSGAMVPADLLSEILLACAVLCGGCSSTCYDNQDYDAGPSGQPTESGLSGDNYSHKTTIKDLKPGTTYCFRIQAVNMGGNVTRSHRKIFRTKPY
jgi:hypothetical protein